MYKDSDLLSKNLDAIKKERKRIAKTIEKIYKSKSNLDTLVKIARFEFDTGYKFVNEYNMNTFEVLISTGNISLFAKDTSLMKSLVELKTLQSLEQKTNDLNRNLYFERLNNYAENFGYYQGFESNELSKTTIDSLLWSHIDGNDFIPKFINLIRSKQ